MPIPGGAVPWHHHHVHNNTQSKHQAGKGSVDGWPLSGSQSFSQALKSSVEPPPHKFFELIQKVSTKRSQLRPHVASINPTHHQALPFPPPLLSPYRISTKGMHQSLTQSNEQQPYSNKKRKSPHPPVSGTREFSHSCSYVRPRGRRRKEFFYDSNNDLNHHPLPCLVKSNILPKNVLLKQQAQFFFSALRGTEFEELVHFAVLLCVQVAPTFRPELAQL